MDANERMTGVKIIQKAKVKSQNYKLKFKSKAKELLTFDLHF